MKPLLILVLTALMASGASGAATIGSESLIGLPSSALYHLEIGNQPDDGPGQSLNPPVFSWLYYEDPALFIYPYNAVRNFRLQLSSSPSFNPLIWNILCSNNFYNFLPPITNSDGSTYTAPIYWRVLYLDAPGTPISYSSTHTFTLASNAKKWDRSMLADTNYLIGIGTSHPHIFFNQNNRDAMSHFLQTNVWPTPGTYWSSVTNVAFQCITQTWWNNAAVFTNTHNWEQYGSFLAQVAFTYQLTTNATIQAADPGTMLELYATNLMAFGFDRYPAYNLNASIPQVLGECYDWLYTLMTPPQRSNVLGLMEKMAQFYVYEDWFYTGTAPNKNRVYTNALACSYYSAAKLGESHTRNDQVGLALTMAGMGESAILRDLQTYFLNYYIAQFDSFQGDDGRAYNSVQNFQVARQFGPFLMATTVFPDAVLANAPIYNNLAHLFAFLEPVGYGGTSELEPFAWGVQGGAGGTRYRSQWGYTRFYDVAVLLNSGPVLRQYNRSKVFASVTPEAPLLGEAFLPFYSPPPAESDWPDSYWLDPVRGWAISCSLPPSDWGSFTNGVGFIFQARPSAAGRMNATYTDGQVEMWAYGAHVTCGGSGNYEEHCMFQNNCLFVDGIGYNNPNPAVSDPWYARFYAFTNTSDFTFAAADLTKAFARTNWATAGYQDIETKFYSYATNARPYISSVTRSVLFPHKKYLVIYDQFQTTQPAHFQWKWNVWQPSAVVNTGACSFTYTATNGYNGSNVTVYVAHVVDPSLMVLTNMTTGSQLTGTNPNNVGKINPFTGENYNGAGDPYGPVDDQYWPYWAHAIWVNNKFANTNWHYLSVVYPVKWGDSAPTITRLDDYTVAVTNGVDGDVISFNTNSPFAAQATLMVAAAAVAPTVISTNRPSRAGAMALPFQNSDILDAPSLAGKLSARIDPVSQFLWNQLTVQEQQALAAPNRNVEVLKPVELQALNRIARGSSIYDPQRFSGVTLSLDSAYLLGQNNLRTFGVMLLNQLLLADAYPQEIGRMGTPGTTMTPRPIQVLPGGP